MIVVLDLAPQIIEKLKRFCAAHGVKEEDVVEHALDEWYSTK